MKGEKQPEGLMTGRRKKPPLITALEVWKKMSAHDGLLFTFEAPFVEQ